MKSCYIPVRLTPQESAMLDELVANNDTTGYENKGELFRLLLWREFCRCKGLPKPKDADWRTCFRIGKQKGANEAKA